MPFDLLAAARELIAIDSVSAHGNLGLIPALKTCADQVGLELQIFEEKAAGTTHANFLFRVPEGRRSRSAPAPDAHRHRRPGTPRPLDRDPAIRGPAGGRQALWPRQRRREVGSALQAAGGRADRAFVAAPRPVRARDVWRGDRLAWRQELRAPGTGAAALRRLRRALAADHHPCPQGLSRRSGLARPAPHNQIVRHRSKCPAFLRKSGTFEHSAPGRECDSEGAARPADGSGRHPRRAGREQRSGRMQSRHGGFLRESLYRWPRPGA